MQTDITRTFCNGMSVTQLYKKHRLEYPIRSQLSNTTTNTSKHKLIIEVNNYIGNEN